MDYLNSYPDKPEDLFINQNLSCIRTSPLTCITAPTGYRKTGAVKEYLALYGETSLWLNLFWDQDEQAVFRSVFLAAVKKQLPEAYNKLQTVTISSASDAARIINILDDACHSESMTLVLDNYDRLETPRLDRFLQYLLECMPEHFHVVLLCQSIPKFVSHEYFLFEQCRNIGKAELKLDYTEMLRHAELLNCKFSETDLHTILSYTNGWPSLTEMLLTGTSGKHMNQIHIATLCGRVYAQAAEKLNTRELEILMVLCRLDNFDAEQANEIIGYESADLLNDLLDRIATETVFLEKEGGFYAIKGAAKEYLQAEAYRTRTPLVLAGEQNLVRWYLISDRIGEALRLLYDRNDFESVLRTLEQHTMEHVSDEDRELLVNVLQHMDFALLSTYPIATIQVAFLLLMSNTYVEKGRNLLAQFRAYVKQAPSSDYDLEDIIGQIDLALASNTDKRLRLKSLICTAARTDSQTDRSISDTWIIPSFLCGIHNIEGHLLAEMKDFKLLCEENGVPEFFAPIKCSHVVQAEYYLEVGNISKAIYSALEGLPEQGHKQSNSITLCAYFTLARACMLAGNFDKARTLIDDLPAHFRNKDSRLESLIDICTGYVYSMLGEWEKVPEWICYPKKNDNQLCGNSSYAYAIRARHFFAQDDFIAFELMSQKWIATIRNSENLIPKIHYLIQKAISAKNIYGMSAALNEIKEAFSIALPDNIIAPFVENGKQLLPILSYGQSNQLINLPDEYSTLLSQLLSKQLHRTVDFSSNSKTLTKREEQILQLLGEGLSYTEIASCLVISKFTVRKHVQNIYTKLNVSDRVNALIRAREYFGME